MSFQPAGDQAVTEPRRPGRSVVRPALRVHSGGRADWLPTRALRNVLVLAGASAVVLMLVVLVGLDGWRYYRTPLRVRGYDPAHKVLRPSGSVGRVLGITGTALMLLMQLYSLRKRSPRLARLGALPRWLDFHIYCGVLGPVLITLHTSFRFNGIVAVAYWSMVLVMLSGFVGRYLYVRIPRSLRGRELSHAELAERADELKVSLYESTLPIAQLRRVEAFEAEAIPAAEQTATWRGLLLGELVVRRRLNALKRELRHAGLSRHLLDEAAMLVAERALLLRRIAYLKKTKRLFDLWHVFHRPLALVMVLIVALHVATALYFGYATGNR